MVSFFLKGLESYYVPRLGIGNSSYQFSQQVEEYVYLLHVNDEHDACFLQMYLCLHDYAMPSILIL